LKSKAKVAGAAPRTQPDFLLLAQKKVSKENGVHLAVGTPVATIPTLPTAAAHNQVASS
jgi:hypothetical protein